MIGYLGFNPSAGVEVFPVENASDQWKLTGYSDASFADLGDEQFHSTAGYCLYLNDTLIDWKSKKIKSVCVSTAEAEYYALYYTSKQAIFYGRLIEEFYEKSVWPIEIFIDNKAVYDVICGGKSTQQTFRKHMATKFYSVSEWTCKNMLRLTLIRSEDNVADIFTKQVYLRLWRNFIGRVLRPQGSIQNLLINDVDSSDNVPVCAENEGESAELEDRSKNGHVGEP